MATEKATLATCAFDVDGCVIDSLTGSSLRPGTVELVRRLSEAGIRLVLWSAGGAEYAEQRARQHGIDTLFAAFHAKADRDPAGRYIVPFAANLQDVVFVDDRPEDMPHGASVVAVSPYLSPNPHDVALTTAAARLSDVLGLDEVALGEGRSSAAD